MNSLFLMLFGIPPKGGNVHLVTSPNYHTAVTTFGGNALHAGHTLVFMDKWMPEDTLEKIERYRVTHTHMVPTQFHRMLALPEEVRAKYDVSSMQWAIHAAAPCPVDVKRKMLDWWGPVIYEYYAATEGGGTLATPQQWLEHPGTVGTAWPISTLRIVDDEGHDVDAGTPGTVYMKMDTVEFEYKGDKAKTEENRLEGFFTVGDIGYLTDDGYLFLCDRKSDMIISGGVNIYPAEIEAELLTDPHGRRRRRVRHPRRRLGRADQGGDRARAGRRTERRARRGDPRACPTPPGQVQVAQDDRLRRRAARASRPASS